MSNPYTDKQQGGNKIRTFKSDVDTSELVWHRDKMHREVTVLEGTGWFFQMDNQLPVELKPGDVLFVPMMEYHRIYKSGETDLTISIKESRVKGFKMRMKEDLKPSYGKGLSQSTKDKRQAQFNKQAKMDDDDPNAYKPAPGDARAKTKPSKYTKAYHKKYGEETELEEAEIPGLKKKAEQSGISYDILKQVYDRGMAAWRTGHRPGAGPHQWAFARVNSFIVGGKTQKTTDADLWAKHKGIKESNEMDFGSDSLAKNYRKNTPGQIEEETWEAGFKRRVVKTTKPEHIEKGFKWRIKGKDRDEISIKLYKDKPDFEEFVKQMKRVAGHEFGG